MSYSQHMQVLESVAQEIRGLGLDGIADNVLVMTVADDSQPELATLPAAVVSPFGQETLANPSNITDDVGYPALVVVLDAAEAVQAPEQLDQRLFWRDRIRDYFHHNRVTMGEGTVYLTSIEPAPILDASAWFDKNIYAGGLTVRCVVRRQRRAES